MVFTFVNSAVLVLLSAQELATCTTTVNTPSEVVRCNVVANEPNASCVRLATDRECVSIV